jgi:hypothetical protein
MTIIWGDPIRREEAKMSENKPTTLRHTALDAELARNASVDFQDIVTAEHLVEIARNESSALHAFFEWDANGEAHGGQQLGQYLLDYAIDDALAGIELSDFERTTTAYRRSRCWAHIADRLLQPGGYRPLTEAEKAEYEAHKVGFRKMFEEVTRDLPGLHDNDEEPPPRRSN